MLEGNNFRFSERDQRRYFDAIVELANSFREARMVVNSVSGYSPNFTDNGTRAFLYKQYLKGVAAAKQADSGNLALKVLVNQTGGRILGPNNDLAGQIDQCIADANSFYRISFDPPPTETADEYHELKVQVDAPKASVRTNTGYYNEPPLTDM